MTAITITDLNNAKVDVDHIADIANSPALIATDRLGSTKRTIAGVLAEMDQDASTQRVDIDAAATTQRTSIQAAADLVLAAAGYVPPVAYVVGLSMTAQTQTVEYNGEVYAPTVASLPFTTSGTFETSKFRLIQGVSFADLEAAVSALRFLQTDESNLGLMLGENAFDNIFAADFSSVTNCTVADAGQTTTFTKTGAASSATSPSVPFPTKDWIGYFQLKLTTGGAGQVANLALGAAGASMTLSLGYDWVAGAAVDGCVSVKWAGTSKVLATGADYVSNYFHVVFQYDSDFQALNVFQKNDTTKTYTFLGSVAGAFAATTQFDVSFAGTTTVGNILTMGPTRKFCYPNIVAIGDSICKGAPFFDPDPASADKNYASCWEGYVQISEVENTLIVNKGIGGQNSQQINARVADDVVAQKPAICVLHLSTNDYHTGLTYAQRTTYTQSSIDLLRNAGIRVILLSAVYPNSGNVAYYPLATDYFQRYMTDAEGFEVLRGYSDYIDFMADAVGDANNEIDPAYSVSDGVHPNTTGYSLIGALIENVLVGQPVAKARHSLEVGGALRVRGLIYGELANRRPWGWVRIQYTNATTSWAIVAQSDNSENFGVVGVAYNISAADLNITFAQPGIVPSTFTIFGTSATFFGIARLVSLTAGTGTQIVARYAISKVPDGSAPTGTELDGKQFLVSY